MTKTEAIELLRELSNFVATPPETDEAISMAIEALEEKYPCGLCKYYEDKEDWGVCQYCPAEPKGSDRMTRKEAIRILRNTAWLGTNEDREKTEQAIEVVAEALEQEPICCKDCKHWHKWENGTGSCHGSSSIWIGTDYDDYCSFAEQKESDEE